METFRRANLTPDALDRFYREGQGIMPFLEAFESRSGVDVGTGVCLELGCGVGKHTHALARRFRQVLGVDVSRAGLGVCAGHMRDFGLSNVSTIALTAPEELAAHGEIDVFFCVSVLQHDPPPIQIQLLESAFSALRPGGFALFQTPDYRKGYSFSAERFLAAEQTALDIHCLPKTDVLATLATNGLDILDFVPDAMVGGLGSFTYFARKGGAQRA